MTAKQNSTTGGKGAAADAEAQAKNKLDQAKKALAAAGVKKDEADKALQTAATDKKPAAEKVLGDAVEDLRKANETLTAAEAELKKLTDAKSAAKTAAPAPANARSFFLAAVILLALLFAAFAAYLANNKEVQVADATQQVVTDATPKVIAKAVPKVIAEATGMVIKEAIPKVVDPAIPVAVPQVVAKATPQVKKVAKAVPAKVAPAVTVVPPVPAKAISVASGEQAFEASGFWSLLEDGTYIEFKYRPNKELQYKVTRSVKGGDMVYPQKRQWSANKYERAPGSFLAAGETTQIVKKWELPGGDGGPNVTYQIRRVVPAN